MPTPLFRDLPPRAAAAVVSAFLGRQSSAEFTEKLAGQHLTARRSGGVWNFSVKSGVSTPGGFFPDVESTLIDHHPPTGGDLVYRFEVVNKRRRPDFIDYDIDKTTAVEFSGALSPASASALNSAQSDVSFLTKDDIKKPVGGLVTNPSSVEILQRFVDKASSDRSVSRAESREVEEILMGLVDSGKVPSSLGGGRVEGLFGTLDGTGFKVPSREYADIQRLQAKFYAVVKANKVKDAVSRFSSAAPDPKSDKLVSDVLDYIGRMSDKAPPAGFRVFFSPDEFSDLRRMSDDYVSGDVSSGTTLAKRFFSRVRNKEAWVSTSPRSSLGIIGTNESMSHGDVFSRKSLRLLREFIAIHHRNLF